MQKPKLVRITTVPSSLAILLKGQFNFMKSYFEVIGIASPGEFLNQVAIETGIRTQAVSMSRTISPIKDLKSLWNLYKFIKKENPSIVHTHTPKAGILGMLAAWLARVPIRMHTVAGLPLMETRGFKRVLLNNVEKLTYRLATKVYPNSKGLYQFLIDEELCLQKKLKVLANGSSNGIDIHHFNIQKINQEKRNNLRNKLDILPSDFVFIFVGRLVGDKGVNELIEAFANISKKNRDLKLLLVGQAEPMLDPLENLTIEEMNRNKNIISVGFQKDVRPYFAISNALVFPTYREGFPNVVMQAGAMSIPSLVTNINGCNEIVIEGINGLIIPVKNVEAIEDGMFKIMNDKFKNPTTNRKMIVNRYEQSIIWEALLKEYNLNLENVS